MQLLNDKYWREILKEQQDSRIKHTRSHILVVNAPANLYSRMDFIKIIKQSEFWYGIRVDSFENVPGIGDMFVWWIDALNDSVVESISTYLQLGYFQNSLTLVLYHEQDSQINFCNDLLTNFKKAGLQSCHSEYFTKLATQNSKQGQIKIEIPFIIFVDKLSATRHLQVRKLAAMHYANIISEQEKILVLHSVAPKAIELQFDQYKDIILAGQDSSAVLSQIKDELEEVVHVNQQTCVKLEVQTTISLCQQLGQKLTSVVVMKPTQPVQATEVLDSKTENKDAPAEEGKIGSRYKRKVVK
ncbi:Hypothetical_protein [Hexamita inflata]|uniref:Hypothetical_protein n=1 Tax=Hexamita inflata TaxID=28002 RepID=A0ABP1H7J0_9EUKA